jgi:hypothetical protein
MFIGGFFAIWFLFMFALVFVPIGFTIYALIDVNRAPDAAFGPPWDNGKSAWTLGLALAFVVPFGTIVGPILWWSQGRSALRERRQVPRPFWSPRPSVPYPYQGQPQGWPQPYPQPYPQQPAQPPADQPPPG